MRCLSPRTVGWEADGKTICFSKKRFNKELSTFQLPCGKCIECRLEYARSWAVRSVHESMVHEKNSFVTLTYSDDKLLSPKLIYSDFQLFVGRLRDHTFRTLLRKHGLSKDEYKQLDKDVRKELYSPIELSVFVTGEYGDKTKRPHWHALLFNWRPDDLVPHYTTDRGDRVFRSELLSELWGHGNAELGDVTFESAGYVARYAAKKLVHGNDDEHEYKPISKKSSKHAIGKRFLEQYWQSIFATGSVILHNGQKCPIPRYYEKWLSKHHPDAWSRYVTQLKAERSLAASNKATEEYVQRSEINWDRLNNGMPLLISKEETRNVIVNERFQRLQSHLKGL